MNITGSDFRNNGGGTVNDDGDCGGKGIVDGDSTVISNNYENIDDTDNECSEGGGEPVPVPPCRDGDESVEVDAGKAGGVGKSGNGGRSQEGDDGHGGKSGKVKMDAADKKETMMTTLRKNETDRKRDNGEGGTWYDVVKVSTVW